MRPQPPDFNDVTKDNLSLLQSKIKDALKRASFISLDTEFTGLGGKEANTRASNIEERYENLCKVVKTHALVAFGVTVFEDAECEIPVSREKQYKVSNFNFTLLSQVDYVVSPQSIEFLSDSGFDFNKQIRRGIPYTPGSSQSSNELSVHNAIMRSIFSDILSQKVPIVIHNGFLDLIYLYYSFYADLPQNLSTFVADLSEMIPGGIFDTKYVSEYVTGESVTFLAYLFRKYEREQVDHKNSCSKDYLLLRIQEGNLHPTIQGHSNLMPSEYHEKAENESTSSKRPLVQRYCEQYALRGFCSQRMRCGNSHDLDFILDEQAKAVKVKRKRRKNKNQEGESTKVHINERDTIDTSQTDPSGQSSEYVSASMPPTLLPSTKPDQFDNFHSAHYDAYMTGFIFARQLLKFTSTTVLSQYKNKLYLMGKNYPLLIEKSEFAKTSIQHQEKGK
ncbi:17249_t:CDS:2 [Acaulospora morrowiae]|uniref:17249_t:CDS:1 n=1 Tax=Acaulospora morrowiae TaxID=94023 RepID=A0A9N8WBJ3_9GLOM|nr:17249_t:CDS:2 [Acaulospora morrowiae]